MSEEIDAHVRRKYDVTSKVGKGAYGIVWKARDRSTNKPVALKKIFDAFQNSTDAQRTFREIMFLQELNAHHHDNIVRLLNVLKADNDRDIYLVFEYMEINLHAVVRAGILEDVHKRYIIYQTARALYYIHSGGLIHRDLKPSNIMLNSDCRAKIIDFGLSRSVSDVFQKDIVLTDYVATRWYRSPEILFGAPQYSTGIDMWALGCILAELMLGKPLFPGESTLNQLERIVSLIGSPTESEMQAIPNKFTGTILQNLRGRPSTFNACFATHNPDAVDLLRRLLSFDPANRLSAAQVLRHPYLALFHDPASEPALYTPVRVHMSDNTRYTITEYRRALYRRIVQRKQELRERLRRAHLARGRLPGPPGMHMHGDSTHEAADPTLHVLPPHGSGSRRGHGGSRSGRRRADHEQNAGESGGSGGSEHSTASASLSPTSHAENAQAHGHAQGHGYVQAHEWSEAQHQYHHQHQHQHQHQHHQHHHHQAQHSGQQYQQDARAYGHVRGHSHGHTHGYPHAHGHAHGHSHGHAHSHAHGHAHGHAHYNGSYPSDGNHLPHSGSYGSHGSGSALGSGAAVGHRSSSSICTHPTAAAAAAVASMDAAKANPYGGDQPRWM